MIYKNPEYCMGNRSTWEKFKRIIMEFHPAGDKAKRDEIVNKLCERSSFELIYETKNILGFSNTNI